MKKLHYFQPLSLIVVLLAMISCSTKNTESNQATKANATSAVLTLTGKQVFSLGIKSSPLTKSLMGMSIFANGMIDVPPQNKSYIAVPFGGYIRDIKVLDGMRVAKGDVLLVVEHPEIIQLQQDYLEVQGNMEFLKAEMDRQKQLLKKGKNEAHKNNFKSNARSKQMS